MIRRVTIAVCAVALAVAMAITSPRPQEQTRHTERERERPELVVTPSAAQNQPLSNPQPPSTTKNPDDWYEWFWPPDWSNWAAVIAGSIGIRVALDTLKVMRGQTQASIDAANAAIAANQSLRALSAQWLDFSEWGCRLSQMQNQDGSFTPVLVLGWIVTNNTERPLTLAHVELRGTPGFKIIVSGHHMVPKERVPIDQVIIQLSEAQHGSIDGSGLGILVVGRAHFIDSLGDTQVTMFGRTGQIRRGEANQIEFHSGPLQVALGTLWNNLVKTEQGGKEA